MNDRNDSARAIRNVMHTVAFGSTDDIDAAFDGLTAMELDELHRIGNELAGYANLKMYNASRTAPSEPFTGDLPMTGNPYPLT